MSKCRTCGKGVPEGHLRCRTHHRAFRRWASNLSTWMPGDDAPPDVYVPRNDGVRALEPEDFAVVKKLDEKEVL